MKGVAVMKLWHVPLRIAAGAFILNSGLSKRGSTGEAAEAPHGMAATAYPQFKNLEPEKFVTLLSTGEVALGAALLLPFFPARLAALGLTVFSVGLNGLYLKLPGMTQEGDIRPTQQGIGLAKDAWLTAIGLALLIDSLNDRDRD